MPYRLRNSKLKQFTHLAGTPPSPFRKKKVAEETSDVSDDSTVQENLLEGQVTNDGEQVEYGTKKYKELYDEGSIAGVSVDKDGSVKPTFHLDEVVIRTNKDGDRIDYDSMPYFDTLSEQEKDLLLDKGPLGRAVTRKAQTKKGLAEDALAIPGQLFAGALDSAAAPQSVMVEGIEAARGNTYNFANALPGSTSRRLPSQVWGFENKPGWDLGGSLNTAMDVVSDPLNLLGAGLASKSLKVPNLIKGGLFKATKSPNPVFAGLTKNAAGPSAIDNLPKLNLFSRFNPKTRQQMKAALGELAGGANVSKAERLKTMSRLSSPEGQSRLYNQELGYLQDQMSNLKQTIKIPQAHAHPFIRSQNPAKPHFEITKPLKIGNFEFGTSTKKIFEKDLAKQARKNVGYRMKEISRPNMNERAANAIQGGKLNFSEGQKLLYGDVPKSIFGNNATFGGFRATNDLGKFSDVGIQNASQFNKGDFVLGTKGDLFNPYVYQHELQHGLQVGRTLPRDVDLASMLNPDASVKSHYNKIISLNKKQNLYSPPSKYDAKNPFYTEVPRLMKKVDKLKNNPPKKVSDFEYFKYGGSGQMEPSGFAGELRASLLNKGFIKDDYQMITPRILSKAKTYFSKKPLFSGTVKGKKVSATRLLDFSAPTKANFSTIAKSLNKLPTLATPVLGGSLIFSGDRK